ncbi:MAG: hypothetical protein ABSF47_02285 [Minisyncoccia bacterium]|jgi:hypothetical protein
MKTSKAPLPNKVLEFYSKIGRPLTAVELARLEPRCRKTSEILEELDKLEDKKTVSRKDGFWAVRGTNLESRRRQDLILDLKWKKLVKLSRWFRFVPFLKFVLANGSLVLGLASESSDFDVLVAVREGRIFTTRYILNLVFSLLRARRLDDLKGSSPNKFCFNHLITPPIYRKDGLNGFGAEIYRNLVPIYGRENDIREFLEANWLYGINPEANLLDMRFREMKPNLFARSLEWLLGGFFGNFVEKKIAEPIARRRLEKYLSHKPIKDRVIVSERELEFHFQLQ